MNLKRISTAALFCAGWVVMLATGLESQQAAKPAKMTEENRYHLRAVNSELDLVQTQINEVAKQLHAQEKVQEKEALIKKICGDAKIPVERCVPNTETGEVTAKPEPKAPVPPAGTNGAGSGDVKTAPDGQLPPAKK